jgi:galactokinase/mevalonate kinase-like predicted kinase
MRIEASAPGRCGILGNPTDGYGGCVISCSLRQRARVVLTTPADALSATVAGKTATFHDRADFTLKDDYFDCVRAVLSYLQRFDLRFRVDVSTDIPLNAGLAGSTAVLVSVLSAVLKLEGKGVRNLLPVGPEGAAHKRFLTPFLSRHYLAEMLRTIELNYLKIQCGYQDQYMTVFGGINYMDFRGKELYRELDEELYGTVEPLERFVKDLPFVVVHTGVKRVSGNVLRPIRERWLDGDRTVVDGYLEIARLCQRAKRALLDADWRTFARLMNDNHRIQQRLGASGEENDRLINIARKNGALAAKLAGAGGGGTIIALTFEPDRMIDALRREGAADVIHPVPSPGVTCTVVEE